jgi:multidrug efflux pump subunit AcrA (membrane-fusion protein)
MRSLRILTLFGVLALAGCGPLGTPEPLPTVVLQGGSPSTPAPAAAGRGGVTASGVVVPAQQAEMAFALGGTARLVHVEAGDPVRRAGFNRLGMLCRHRWRSLNAPCAS